jgi:hypothetical protein
MQINRDLGWARWNTPVTAPRKQRQEDQDQKHRGSHMGKVLKTQSPKITRAKWTGVVAQIVEHLLPSAKP